MPVTITKTAYPYAELSPEAQETARQWYANLIGSDEIGDSVVSDAAEVADRLGISFKTRPVKLHGGGTRYDPCVYWTLSYCQRDGAHFEGSYSYKKGSVATVCSYAPEDIKLHDIARRLYAVQRRNFYRITADVTQGRGYEHGATINVDNVNEKDAVTVAECLRDFMRWIYDQLRANYNYLTSDEQVAEAIEANGYLFDEDGNRSV
jgi:hypothetical protein